MKVVLYTTHCPKCMVLEKKMATKGIVYEIVTDTSLMIKKGFSTAPMLEVDDKLMDFKEANTWINEQ